MFHTGAQSADVLSGADLRPLGVYLIAFSLFATGSAEFLLAGVLPEIADDLHITLSAIGALISAFAVGVVVGGPPRVFTIATQAPTLAGATTVSAFQLGISLVPVLAGAVLNTGAGVDSVTWIGAALAAATVPTVLLDRAISRRRSRRNRSPA